MRWDGELYEVLSVEPRASGGFRHVLAPWDDRLLVRNLVEYGVRETERPDADSGRAPVAVAEPRPPARARRRRRDRLRMAATARRPRRPAADPPPRGPPGRPRAPRRRPSLRVAASRPPSGPSPRLRPVGPLRLVLPLPGDGRGDLLPRPRAGAHPRRLVLRLLGAAGDRHDHRLRAEPGRRRDRLGRRSSSSR